MWWIGAVGCARWVGLPSALPAGAPALDCVGDVPAADPDRLMATVRALAASPRESDPERARAREWLVRALADGGRAVESLPFEIAGVDGVNLLARGAPGARVLVGAHYDSVDGSPGADDNASGAAALVEVARLLGPAAPVDVVLFDREEPQASQVGRDSRNFAFGSQAFVDAGVGYERVFVLESVGLRCADEGCQARPGGLPPGLVEVDGTAIYWILGGGGEWADLLATFGAAAAPTPALGVSVPGRGGVIRQTRFSDHAPFWDAGVPAVMITDTALLRNPDYHGAGDRPEALDPAFLAQVTGGAAAAAAQAAGMCGSTQRTAVSR